MIALIFVVLLRDAARSASGCRRRLRPCRALGRGTEVMTTSGLYGTVAASATTPSTWRSRPGVTVRWARPAIPEMRKPRGRDATGADAATAPTPARAGTGRTIALPRHPPEQR